MKCVRKIPKNVLIEDILSFKITKSYVSRPMKDNKKQSLLNTSHVKRWTNTNYRRNCRDEV